MRIGTIHDLAVHLEDEAQHAVGRRMLWPEVQRVAVDLDPFGFRINRRTVANISLAHGTTFPASVPSRCAFSSPGSVVMPSQGEMKSNRRKSWVSFTGS
jgi:hypothetical protein